MTIGFDKDLYVLPFDHRATFRDKMFGWKEPTTAEQTAQIAEFKQVIYDALKAAVPAGVPGKEQAFWWTSSSAQPFCATRKERVLHRHDHRKERPG